MFDKMFRVPMSEAEIALDRAAFENWLAGIRTTWEPIPSNPEFERRLARQRQRWVQSAKEREAIATKLLQVRMAAQRALREEERLRQVAVERERSLALQQVILARHALAEEARKLRELTNGVFTFGVPCVRCHSRLRYCKSRACVECSRSTARIDARNMREQAISAALAVGSTDYHGKPCRVCGSTLRYVSSNRCIRCERKRERERSRLRPRKTERRVANAQAN
jgi:hypothetical protein